MNITDDQTRILIVDDHALVREGLCEILRTQADLDIVGEAGDSATAVAMAGKEQPDVILLDIEIPGGEVTTTIRQIRSCAPESRVIILSMYEGPQLLNTLLAVGIHGYLLKSIHWQELAVAIRAVKADRTRIILGVSAESLNQLGQGPTSDGLSAREREVLDLVAAALSNGQIASRLGLTEATVKRHLRNIFVKLGAVSRIDAVKKAEVLRGTSSASVELAARRAPDHRLADPGPAIHRRKGTDSACAHGEVGDQAGRAERAMREFTERKRIIAPQHASSLRTARVALSGSLYAERGPDRAHVDRSVRIGPAADGGVAPRSYRWLNGSRVPAITCGDIVPRAAWPAPEASGTPSLQYLPK